MFAISGAVLCLSFILGLLFTGFSATVRGIPVGAIVLLLLGVFSAFLMPKWWRTGVRSRVWLLAGVVGFLAAFYFQWRLPHPGSTDISHLIPNTGNVMVTVEGKITTSPRLTQSQRIQFELTVKQAELASASSQTQTIPQTAPQQPISGNVYVTVPLLQGTGLYPSQRVRVTGSLYKPKPAANPGGFNFEKYLAQQGIFAGLSGRNIESLETRQPQLWWSIRQKIIRSQVAGAGVPEGALISAMVMGGKTVDVPQTVRDQFKTVGLAHALAASGAQVSLLIGVVLTLTRRYSAKWQMSIGTAVLLLYIGLTGLEAAVLRAGVMGFVALLAMVAERKVKPIGSILFAATLLLVWNPLLIWDVGFQLSFLATLGLIVTVPVLTKWLDWLPSVIAPLFAVPIAAYLWTLPLQLFVFGVVSPYSIGINILSSPLVALISIGGMISAVLALVYPPLGSVTAWILSFPTAGFIKLAEWGSQLPGSTYAVGTITVLQVVILYALFVLIWQWRRSQPYWWVAGLVSVSLVAVPVWYIATQLMQITVLATSSDPVLVVQARGKVGLINSGSETDAKFIVLPFLRQQGINQIDWAMDMNLQPTDRASWQRIGASLPIRAFYSGIASEPIAIGQDRTLTTAALSSQQTIQQGVVAIQVIQPQPAILQLRFANQNWLLLHEMPPMSQQSESIAKLLPQANVLWWSGKEANVAWLEAVQPQVTLGTEQALSAEVLTWCQKHSVTTYNTNRDGVIQWTPNQGFITPMTTADLFAKLF